jgi:ketosteroid isomerase-like protein
MSDKYILIVVNTNPDKKSEFEITSKPKWVEMIRSRRENYSSVEIHDLKVLLNGEIATVTGQYSQVGTSDGKDITSAGLYVDTWVKRMGQWQLVSSVFP